MRVFDVSNAPVLVGLGFATLAFVAFWVVRWGFKKLGWRTWGAPLRQIQIRSRVVSRLLGMLAMGVGIVIVRWSWEDVHTGRTFSYRDAVGGPVIIGYGLFVAIAAPLSARKWEIRVARVPPLLAVCGIAGLVAGFIYAEYLRTGRIPLLR